MNVKTTAIFGIVGALLFVATAVISGFQFKEYSHISQFISEGYATGTPYGLQIRLMGYIPSGLLLFFFGWKAPAFFEKSNLVKSGFIGFALFYGLATVVVSLFPCDIGCNREWENPSLSQIIHNISAAGTYIVVPVSLFLVGLGMDKTKKITWVSMVLGIISGIFAMAIFSDYNSSYVGLFQRIAEGAILTWVIVVAYILLKKNTIKKSK